jgi:hypothetical protein
MIRSSGDDADFNQIDIPPSFVALFVPAGRIKPTEPRAVIAERYEFCEDLAQMLVDTAQQRLFELSVHETDVLRRIREGLGSPGQPVSAVEADWVVRRLAEVLGWSWEPPTS